MNDRDSNASLSARLHLSLVVPLVTVAAWAITRSYFHEVDEAAYLGWSVVAAVSGGLFARSLARGGARALLRWLVFIQFFFGYLVQVWWAVLDPAISEGSADTLTLLSHVGVSPTTLLEAYRQIAGSYLAAAVVVNLLDAFRNTRPDMGVVRVDQGRRAVAIGVAISAVCLPAMGLFHVGQIGAHAELPFHLGGVMLYAQRTLVPAAALFGIVAAERAGDPRLRRASLVLLVVSGVLDTVLTTSKTPLVLSLARYCIILVVMGRMTAARLRKIALAGCVVALMFPLFGIYRIARTAQTGDWLGDMRSLSEDVAASDGALQGMLRPALFRLSGAGILAVLVGKDAELPPNSALDVLTGKFDVGRYVTRDVYGFPEEAVVGIAPSVLGWLYIVFGATGQWVGVAVMLVLVEVAWMLLARARLRARPVVLTLFAIEFALLLSEGTFDKLPMSCALLAAAGIFLEVLARSADSSAGPLLQPAPKAAAGSGNR